MGNLLIYSATVGNFCIWPQALPHCRPYHESLEERETTTSPRAADASPPASGARPRHRLNECRRIVENLL